MSFRCLQEKINPNTTVYHFEVDTESGNLSATNKRSYERLLEFCVYEFMKNTHCFYPEESDAKSDDEQKGCLVIQAKKCITLRLQTESDSLEIDGIIKKIINKAQSSEIKQLGAYTLSNLMVKQMVLGHQARLLLGYKLLTFSADDNAYRLKQVERDGHILAFNEPRNSHESLADMISCWDTELSTLYRRLTCLQYFKQLQLEQYKTLTLVHPVIQRIGSNHSLLFIVMIKKINRDCFQYRVEVFNPKNGLITSRFVSLCESRFYAQLSQSIESAVDIGQNLGVSYTYGNQAFIDDVECGYWCYHKFFQIFRETLLGCETSAIPESLSHLTKHALYLWGQIPQPFKDIEIHLNRYMRAIQRDVQSEERVIKEKNLPIAGDNPVLISPPPSRHDGKREASETTNSVQTHSI